MPVSIPSDGDGAGDGEALPVSIPSDGEATAGAVATAVGPVAPAGGGARVDVAGLVGVFVSVPPSCAGGVSLGDAGGLVGDVVSVPPSCAGGVSLGDGGRTARARRCPQLSPAALSQQSGDHAL